MEQSLADLRAPGVITPEAAFSRSSPARPAPRPARARPASRTDFGGCNGASVPTQTPSRTASGSPRRCKRHMDLKKEIKLSDLVRRPQKKTRAGAKPSGAPAQAGAEAGARRAQDRRLAARRLARGQQRRPGEARAARAAVPLEPGVVVAGEVRDVPALASALDELFRDQQASAPRRPPRRRHEPDRRALRSTWRGSRTSASSTNAIRFRAHEALSIPIDEAVLDYHVVSRERRRGGAALAPHRPRRRLPRVDRPLRRGLQGRPESSSSASTSRPLPCCAPSRLPAAGDDEHGRRRRGLDRPRPHDARDLRRRRLRLHARPRVGRRERSRPQSRATSASARTRRGAEARARPRATTPSDARTIRVSRRARAVLARELQNARARARRLAPVLPEPARLARDLDRS